MRGGGTRARPVLPLRATPPGELLDAAVALFRVRALPLLLLAAPLLAVEQVVAWYAGATWLDQDALFGDWWRVVAAMLACEAVIVGLLGAYAGAATGPALVGEKVTHRALFRRMRPLPALVTMLIPALLGWPVAYFGLIGWVGLYGFLGLAGVALVIDRPRWPFGALGRAAVLAAQLSWRGVWARLRAFLIWTVVRVAHAIGPITFLWKVGLVADGYLGDWPVLLVWGLAGTVSCAVLACFDAVLLIDTRIRVEGLDIEVRRALATGADVAPVLVHTRSAVPEAGRHGLTPMRTAPPRLQALVRPSVPPGLSRQDRRQWMRDHPQDGPNRGHDS